MASVYRKTVTRKLPAGAELFIRKGEQLARWKDRTGKRQTAPVMEGRNGSLRIRTEAGTYTAKYRDGSGVVRETATGCRSKDAAQAVLNELVERAERVRSGIVTVADDAVRDWLATPFEQHLLDYLENHRNRGNSPNTIEGVEIRLRKLVRECKLTRLADLTATTIERWLSNRRAEGMAPRTRNSYLEVAKAFANWCVESDRLAANPLAKLRKVDQQTDRRIVRRSMTAEELRQLLYVVRSLSMDAKP